VFDLSAINAPTLSFDLKMSMASRNLVTVEYRLNGGGWNRLPETQPGQASFATLYGINNNGGLTSRFS